MQIITACAEIDTDTATAQCSEIVSMNVRGLSMKYLEIETITGVLEIYHSDLTLMAALVETFRKATDK